MLVHGLDTLQGYFSWDYLALRGLLLHADCTLVTAVLDTVVSWAVWLSTGASWDLVWPAGCVCYYYHRQYTLLYSRLHHCGVAVVSLTGSGWAAVASARRP